MQSVNWLDLLYQVLQQLPLTLLMIVLSLIFALILGFILATIRLQKIKLLSPVVKVYISFIRSTPLLLQLFLVYFALPQLLLFVHIDINHFSRLFFVILAFTLHTGAYLSEIIRAGYQSVDYRQIEAGLSIGLTYPRILKEIILPQALRNSIPNLTTQIIELVKDTSLAFTIGIIDMMGQVKLIIGNNYGLGMLEVYIVISVVYWLIALIIQGVFTIIDKRAQKPYQI
ncbi:amino acid ABC transporter permease [Staphylococcus saprophyticus]|uniref:Putative ABC-type amino acid transport system permease component n=1 Tax=Staphylococcus saprophyticus subsp. saprophyticus (strain ATCC 15305 / DSM 20229 / NCIMB 8711 / NCTC 7292 / S-41) TaxID=342451 RepID=Q49ZL2_STAS1|nr:MULTISPECIES: amino acid ABC transporter permease [Staphylococcus]CRV28542.1 amino acid ABC transporter permease [Streptococcus equi subsp. equi]AMG19694.1 amino acid ABC transporter permease [Staphylococcus saprophyticus]AMG32798.1 amino acid ABC transporter permease [Staphylococcus saprophyticus]ASE58733.1 amino acid ABC transporter permease [Staphylococcus saprophyticus]ASF19705.1 amino acid ABC transporter permease [Staphylococcus saprophyticus]